MKVGYFLKNLQEVDLQADLLNTAGVTTIYSDIATSVDRPGFLQLLADASIGDCIVIPNFVGLGTSPKDLIGRLTEIETHGLSFATLTDNINSSSPANAFIAALVNFDRCRMLARIGHRRKPLGHAVMWVDENQYSTIKRWQRLTPQSAPPMGVMLYQVIAVLRAP